MAYNPQNVAIYLAAFEGAQAGIAAAGKWLADLVEEDYGNAALQADALAQAVDMAWGSAAATNADVAQVMLASFGIWVDGRSTLPSNVSASAAAYATVAAGIVLLAQEGTEQIVAEGINPNAGGGGGSGGVVTVATITGNTTKTISGTDRIVKFDTSNGNTATAKFPTTPFIGETHTFFWFAWNVSQVPPQINGNGNSMTPATGMASSGLGGLVTSTSIPTPGGFITYQWDGSEWLQTA
jgi:hypothetical protein